MTDHIFGVYGGTHPFGGQLEWLSGSTVARSLNDTQMTPATLLQTQT